MQTEFEIPKLGNLSSKRQDRQCQLISPQMKNLSEIFDLRHA